MIVIINRYKQRLNEISDAVEEDVKQYITSLLEDVGSKSTEEQRGLNLNNCGQVNIGAASNYGEQNFNIQAKNKKRKVSEEPLPSTPPTTTVNYVSDESSEEEVEIIIEEDVKLSIWELWEKVLDIMQTQDDIDQYSLEKLNVIQLGNKIGFDLTRKYYPKSLIEKTEIIIKVIPDFFVEDQDFYNRLFDTIILNNEQNSKDLLAEVYFSVFKSNKPFMKFFHVVINSFVSGLFIESNDVYKSEISYNYRIIWPMLDCLAKLIDATSFQPGEVRIKAIFSELKSMVKDHSSFYNADGVIIFNKYNIEIAVLENTGPNNASNNTKDSFLSCAALLF